MKQDFRKLWKDLASNKLNNVYHSIEYCALKAFTSKNTDKKKLFLNLLAAAFMPRNTKIKNTLDNNYWIALRKGRILDTNPSDLFDNEHQTEEFYKFYRSIDIADVPPVEERYTYIFVRKDLLTPVQVAVQASHATFVAGKEFKPFYPETVNFVLCGVDSRQELIDVMKHLNQNKISYVKFQEPDLRNELTAIATRPIRARSRGPLLTYQTLTIEA